MERYDRLGSSPRLRGTLQRVARADERIGIIPALAGNTPPANSKHRRSRDHPRACGEHWLPCQFVAPSVGSSPRLRGTHELEWGVGIDGGIIPALAGNTDPLHTGYGDCRDHPRACGEHRRCRCRSWPCPGSSPRLRGTLAARPSMPIANGIIPALAGNTPCGTRAWRRAWDHPRACGEHGDSQTSQSGFLGSSPRLRGTLDGVGVATGLLGIIPALAGNTISSLI